MSPGLVVVDDDRAFGGASSSSSLVETWANLRFPILVLVSSLSTAVVKISYQGGSRWIPYIGH